MYDSLSLSLCLVLYVQLRPCYVRQGGFIFIGVCLFVCLFGLRKNYLTDFVINFGRRWYTGHGRNH